MRKTCFKCGVEQPLGQFYAHPGMTDGRLNKCKTCTKADVKKNRVENLETIRAYDRRRGRTEERKKLNNERARKDRENGLAITRNKRYALKYPEKRIARVTVGNAIRDGKLEKKPCEVCGSVKSEAHHEDYSKPLEVRWLCRQHHAEIHRIYDD